MIAREGIGAGAIEPIQTVIGHMPGKSLCRVIGDQDRVAILVPGVALIQRQTARARIRDARRQIAHILGEAVHHAVGDQFNEPDPFPPLA